MNKTIVNDFWDINLKVINRNRFKESLNVFLYIMAPAVVFDIKSFKFHCESVFFLHYEEIGLLYLSGWKC